MELWKQAKINENSWSGIHIGWAVQSIQNKLPSGAQEVSNSFVSHRSVTYCLCLTLKRASISNPGEV